MRWTVKGLYKKILSAFLQTYMYKSNILILIFLLTSPNVLSDKSTNFPAEILVGVLDIIISNITLRAFLFGRRYHSSSQDAMATFSAYC